MASRESGGTENPAGRLREFVVAFNSKINVSSTTKDALSNAYGITTRNAASLTQLISDVWQIPAQIRTELAQVQGLEAGPYLEVVTEFENALTYLGLERPPEEFATHVSGEMLRSLKMIEALLNKDIQRMLSWSNSDWR